jgi:DNA-binding protein YbaB
MCLVTKILDSEHLHIEVDVETNKICIHSLIGQSDDCDTIEDALASYINDIWQDLTESEQEQIRSILNG